jgi:hypothetical protein
MDSAAAPAMVTATPATSTTGKKQAKPKKAAKDMTEERWTESTKHAGRREAAKARKAAVKLEEEWLRTNDRIITQRQHANGKLLAHKAAQQAIMMMKQEALNVAFGHGVVIPLAAGASSTSSITSTPSGRPPL